MILDQASDFSKALQVYQEACVLLQEVSAQLVNNEDRKKIDLVVSAQHLKARSYFRADHKLQASYEYRVAELDRLDVLPSYTKHVRDGIPDEHPREASLKEASSPLTSAPTSQKVIENPAITAFGEYIVRDHDAVNQAHD